MFNVAIAPNVIAPLLQFPDFEFGVAPRIFYSSIPILDSNNQTGPWVNVSHSSAFGPAPPAIQSFRCSLSLVQQTAILNSTTREVVSLEGAIDKTTSKWQPFSGGFDDFFNTSFANPQGLFNIVRH